MTTPERFRDPELPERAPDAFDPEREGELDGEELAALYRRRGQWGQRR